MTTNWIRKPGRVTTPRFVRFYEWHGSSGSGFSFDCDEQGVVDEDKLLPCGLASLADCRRGWAEVGEADGCFWFQQWGNPTLVSVPRNEVQS